MQRLEAIRFPEAGVISAIESPYGCLESNLCPLEGQPMLLTTEPYPQALIFNVLISIIPGNAFWHCFLAL